MKKNIFTITGMKCGSCKMLIEDIAKGHKGIKSFVINFETGKVDTEYEENFDWEEFQKELRDIGDYVLKITN